MAASLDALASRVEDMSVEQVEEATVRVISETGHVQTNSVLSGPPTPPKVEIYLRKATRRHLG